MKPLSIIGLFLFALAACVQKPQVPELVEGPSPELSAIDSLMWSQPDSALLRLLPCFDTCCREALNASQNYATDSITRRNHCVSTTFDRHYANLLLSELLYKNDYPQTNRRELQQALAYLDSLTVLADTRGVSLQPRPRRDARRASVQNIAFLDARVHYINGVGYYENDSAVPACKEYMKALEVMEERFEEKELVGKKAKFMTYTYNRLGDLFSEQFMMEPAIVSYKNSYKFSLISPISSYSVPNALNQMGIQFNIKGEKDSANYYYSQALMNMPDSTNPYYRDVVSNQSLLSYQLTHQAEASIKRLKQIAALAGNEDERLTRYMVVGDILRKVYMILHSYIWNL